MYEYRFFFFYISAVFFNILYNFYLDTLFIFCFWFYTCIFWITFFSALFEHDILKISFLGLSNCKNVCSRNFTTICRTVEYTDPFLFNHISQTSRGTGNVWADYWGRLWLLICNIIPGLFYNITYIHIII